ncbi:MAG: tetratricopeptide repeat protein [Sandaracinaceae bacterium]|nr:tetratricopeptide repeat protein [Sandaracinaceae bacterium]
MRWISASLLAIGLVTLAAAAAQAQTTPDDERARIHFESGRSYFAEGAYERALQEFQEAYQLSPRTLMLFNLGTTYERLGRYGEAADAFERYANEMGAELEDGPVLRRRIENLRRRAESGSATPDTGPEPIDGGGGTPSRGDDGSGLIIGGAVALGVAGVGLVLTAVFGGLAMSEESSVRDGCFVAGNCTPDAVSGMDSLALAADISWITAAVAGGVGIVLVVLGVTSGGSGSEQASVRFTGNGLAGSF